MFFFFLYDVSLLKYEKFYSATCCSLHKPHFAASGLEFLPAVTSFKGYGDMLIPRVNFPQNMMCL